MTGKPRHPAGGADATLGAVIRTHREAAGHSQRQLAGMAGIHYSYLTRLEAGTNDRPTAEVLQRLADALEIDQDELLRFIGVKTLPEPRVYYRRAYKLTDDEAAEADERMREIIAELRRKHRREQPGAE